jgi:hypothetical protein
MSRQLGRISGPLLSANIQRDGVDLAFETDLLYLSVDAVDGLGALDPTKFRIGINSDAIPTDSSLFVNDTIRSTNLITTTQFTVPNFSITTDTIQQLTGTLYIQPNQADTPTITAVALGTSRLKFDNNEILNATADSNINFSPIGSGITNIRNSVEVLGDLHATGNITWDGDITLGNSADDNITFASDVNSDIVPNYPLDALSTELNDSLTTESGDVIVNEVLESYNLGSSVKVWNTIHSNIVNTRSTYADLTSVTTMTAGNFVFNNNTITNTVSTEPMYLTPNGTGQVLFNNNNYVYGNNFINQFDTPFTLASTGQGYVKFTGNKGLAIPLGPTVGPEGAELGMIRYNTDLGYVRVFNGTDWISAMGSSSSVSIEETYDTMDIWSLVLG